MTIRTLILAFIVSGLVLSGCLSVSGRRGGLTDSQIASIPKDLVTNYTLFSKRCSRCHTLSRPINAPISSIKHWKAYVNRMRLNPSSGISPKDAQKIVAFLDYWRVHRDEILAGKEGATNE